MSQPEARVMPEVYADLWRYWAMAFLMVAVDIRAEG